MKYILDTCVIIDLVRGDANTIRRMKSRSPNQVMISTITEFELKYGMEQAPNLKSRSRSIVENILSEITILDFGSEEATQAAKVRNSLKTQGTPIGPYDVLIAASALTRDAILVTSNEKEFTRIQKLKIENWR